MFFWYFLISLGTRFYFHSLHLFIYTLLLRRTWSCLHLFFRRTSFNLLQYLLFLPQILLFLFFLLKFLITLALMISFMSVLNTKDHRAIFAFYDSFGFAEIIVFVEWAYVLTFLYLLSFDFLFVNITITFVSVVTTEILVAHVALETKIV